MRPRFRMAFLDGVFCARLSARMTAVMPSSRNVALFGVIVVAAVLLGARLTWYMRQPAELPDPEQGRMMIADRGPITELNVIERTLRFKSTSIPDGLVHQLPDDEIIRAEKLDGPQYPGGFAALTKGQEVTIGLSVFRRKDGRTRPNRIDFVIVHSK